MPLVGRASGDTPSSSDVVHSRFSLPEGLTLYHPNYALPLTWSDSGSGKEDIEFKFQISLKYQVLRSPVYVAYTQVSNLRWLDADDSRPFRETNYKPEIWYRFRPGRLEPDWLGLDLGFEHASNGEGYPGSRSWNRLYARPWFDSGHWAGSAKLWYRIPEGNPSTAKDPQGDDNPDITDYYGHDEFRLRYTFDNGSRLSAMARVAFSGPHAGLQLEYAVPADTESGYWFVQVFKGYGESLQTYQHNRTRIGIGFALLD